jgi:hypothetical protein
MPWIEGRFYMNPVFGRALERARAAEEGQPWSEEDRLEVQPLPNARTDEEGEYELLAAQNHAHHAESRAGRLMRESQAASPHYENPQNEREARLANVIYNETASLRSDPRIHADAPGSSEDLWRARAAIGEIAARVLSAGHPTRVAPSELTISGERALAGGNPAAIEAHNAGLAAARAALAGSDTTSGAMQYRLRSREDAHTPINGRATRSHFGPFRDTLSGRRTIVIAR